MEKIFADRYELIEELGNTPLTILYKARDLQEGSRIVALKVLREAYHDDQNIAAKFIERSLAVHAASLKYCASLYVPAEQGDQIFIVREYVEGVNLAQHLRQAGGRLAASSAIQEIVPQICEALHSAHNQHIVHGGLNPNDIILTTYGEVKVTDFGVSFLALLPALNEQELSDNALTYLKYAAPELFSIPKIEDGRSDIYSVGIITYELLLGDVPFSGSSLQGYCEAHTSKPLPLTVSILNRALDKLPEKRYQDPREFGSELFSLVVPPVLAVQTEALDMGSLKQGEKKSVTLTICNAGTGKLSGTVITDHPECITIIPDHFELLADEGVSSSPVVVITVGVDPAKITGDDYKAHLNITSNGGDKVVTVSWEAERTLRYEPLPPDTSIQGEEKKTRYSITPKRIQFGRVRPSSSARRQMLIHNTDDATLALNIKVSDPQVISLTGVNRHLEEDGWYSIDLNARQDVTASVMLERGRLPMGIFSGKIVISADDETTIIPVTAEIISSAPTLGISRESGKPLFPALRYVRWAALLIGVALLIAVGYVGGNMVVERLRIKENAPVSAPPLEEIRSQLLQGNYSAVRREIEKLLPQSEEASELNDILKKLKNELSYSINLHYLSNNQNEQNELPSIPSGGSYRLKYETNDSSYLYVFQIDTQGKVAVLHPNTKYSSVGNPVNRNSAGWLPSDAPEIRWFRLDNHVGEEQIYFIASRWPNSDIEQLFQQLADSLTDDAQAVIRSKLLERFQTRVNARTEGINGIFCQVTRFNHIAQ